VAISRSSFTAMLAFASYLRDVGTVSRDRGLPMQGSRVGHSPEQL
jgi:hypothetical protein